MSKPEKSFIFEYSDMPDEVQIWVQEYYRGTDRPCYNYSYEAFPVSWDLPEMISEGKADFPLCKWFLSQLEEIPSRVIVHFDW